PGAELELASTKLRELVRNRPRQFQVDAGTGFVSRRIVGSFVALVASGAVLHCCFELDAHAAVVLDADDEALRRGQAGQEEERQAEPSGQAEMQGRRHAGDQTYTFRCSLGKPLSP